MLHERHSRGGGNLVHRARRVRQLSLLVLILLWIAVAATGQRSPPTLYFFLAFPLVLTFFFGMGGSSEPKLNPENRVDNGMDVLTPE